MENYLNSCREAGVIQVAPSPIGAEVLQREKQ